MERKIFSKFLKDKGLRLTKERVAILTKAFDCHDHFDPESLHSEIKKTTGIKASRATIYRTLNLLCECGLIEKVSKTDRGTFYEHTFGHRHHDHMMCVCCGKIIEFYSEDIEKLQDELCGKQGFLGKSHILEIKGYCRRCQKEGRLKG
ncbi:MAG: Fur family transcriptional regulator [Nitrospirota bacterium]